MPSSVLIALSSLNPAPQFLFLSPLQVISLFSAITIIASLVQHSMSIMKQAPHNQFSDSNSSTLYQTPLHLHLVCPFLLRFLNHRLPQFPLLGKSFKSFHWVLTEHSALFAVHPSNPTPIPTPTQLHIFHPPILLAMGYHFSGTLLLIPTSRLACHGYTPYVANWMNFHMRSTYLMVKPMPAPWTALILF